MEPTPEDDEVTLTTIAAHRILPAAVHVDVNGPDHEPLHTIRVGALGRGLSLHVAASDPLSRLDLIERIGAEIVVEARRRRSEYLAERVQEATA